jgi:nucleoside-diphosphate-sugar epimerase
MATCLVTGGAGNLACQLTWALADRFDRVVLLDVSTRPVGSTAPNACFERGDLLDGAGLDALFARHAPTAVIHLASLLSGSCEQDRSLAWRVNMDGTFGLFEAALQHGRPTVLFASSVAAFGGQLPAVLTDDTPQWPATLYGVTKMAAERLGCYYHEKHGLDFRCVRLPITVSRHAPAGAASAIASHAFLEAARTGRFTFTARPDTPLAFDLRSRRAPGVYGAAGRARGAALAAGLQHRRHDDDAAGYRGGDPAATARGRARLRARRYGRPRARQLARCDR